MHRVTSNWQTIASTAAALTLGALLAGCGTTQPSEQVNAPLHEVKNVYRAVIKLPTEIRRVAILPIAVDEHSPDAVSGRESFQSILFQEALQTHEFEPIQLTREQLVRWFGRPAYAADEVLPSDLLERIEKESGANAVILSRLSTYRPYPPVAEGWSLKLVWCKNAEVFWTVEDLFDLSDARVAASAKREFKSQEAVSAALIDPANALQSPRRIAQFALRTMFATMPKH
jgi:hypothetical protein